MDDDVITILEWFVLQHEQAHVALHSLGLAACVEAVDLLDLHRNAKAHDLLF